MSKKHHYAAGPCLNCSTVLQEGWEFCPNCGQKNQELKLPLSHVLEEVAEGIWHFDSKLWATLKAIVTRPGKITVDFLDGRRVRYVPPIRLYVFISFVFFFAASVMQHRSEEAEAEAALTHPKSRKGNGDFTLHIGPSLDADTSEEILQSVRKEAHLDTVVVQIANAMDKGIVVSAACAQSLQGLRANEVQKRLADTMLVAYEQRNRLLPDSDRTYIREGAVSKSDTVLLRPLKTGERLAIRLPLFDGNLVLDSANIDTLLHRTKAERDRLLDRTGVEGRIRRLGATRAARLVELGRHGDNPNEWAELWHLVFKAASIGMFLFMPLAAFFLWLLFRHQRRFYVEHLIHALHLHAIVFLLIILLELVPGILFPHHPFGLLNWALGSLILAYPFLSIRRVYRQRLRRTLLKYLLWIVLYGILMVLFVAGVFVYGLLTV